MSESRHQLVMPDLGLPDVPVTASVWLVTKGAEVNGGERLLEVVAGEVTVDLPSPATGRLTEQLVAEDDPLYAGQILGVIAADAP